MLRDPVRPRPPLAPPRACGPPQGCARASATPLVVQRQRGIATHECLWHTSAPSSGVSTEARRTSVARQLLAQHVAEVVRERGSALVGPLLHDVLRIVHDGLAQLLALAALAAIGLGATARSCCRMVASTVCCLSCRKMHGPQAWSNASPAAKCLVLRRRATQPFTGSCRLARLGTGRSALHNIRSCSQSHSHTTRSLACRHRLPVQPQGCVRCRTYRALQRACQSGHLRPLAHFSSKSGVEQAVLERGKGLRITQAKPLAELLLLPAQQLPRLANIYLPVQDGLSLIYVKQVLLGTHCRHW